MSFRWAGVRVLLCALFVAIFMGHLGPAQNGPQARFLHKWGTPGGGSGQFSAPEAVAVGPNDHVYVVDTYNHRIQVFDQSGEFLSQWGSLCDLGTQEGCLDPDGSGPLSAGDGQFKTPEGIAIDAIFELVYITDSENHRIQVFDLEGSFIRKWGKFGSTQGLFYIPVGLSLDEEGLLYVSDVFNHRVQVFNESGTYIRQWGTRGGDRSQFEYPSSVAVSNERAYVSDNGNHRIQIFDLAGNFIGSFGTLCSTMTKEGCVDPDGTGPLEPGDGQLRLPFGIAGDPNGNLFVIDQGNNRVQAFGPEGSFLAVWGSICAIANAEADPARINCKDPDAGGSLELGDGQFYSPKGIAVDDQGKIYIADSDNHRVQVFELR